MLKYYPWQKLEKGQGFFVPALDLNAEREAGLRAAVPCKIKDAQAVFALHQGKIGVLFCRRAPYVKYDRTAKHLMHPESLSTVESLPDATDPEAAAFLRATCQTR